MLGNDIKNPQVASGGGGGGPDMELKRKYTE
jgi:hypothetical protein